MTLTKPLFTALSVLWLVTASVSASGRPDRIRQQADGASPQVRIAAINGMPIPDARPASPHFIHSLDSIALEGRDDQTSPDELVYLVQLAPVNAPGAVMRDPITTTGQSEITAYRGEVLLPGRYALRAQTRDGASNYSTMDEIALIVPSGTAPAVASERDAGLGLLFALLAGAGLGAAGAWVWRDHRTAQAVAAATEARSEWAIDRHFNPFISGEPVRQPEMFFARHDLLQRMVNGLHQNSIMVQGERRMGKTSLLYQLADRLRQSDDPEWVFIPAPVDLEGTPQDRFFHLLMEGAWNGARGLLLGDPPALRMHAVSPLRYSDRDFAADLRFLIGALSPGIFPRLPRLVLMIDEVDAINAYDPLIQQQLRRVLVSDLAENVGAVVAGSNISKAWERQESPWYNLFYEVTLEPFTDEQAAELLTEPVRGVYEWDQDAMARVIAVAEGRPYRLQQMAFAAVNHMLADRRLRITLADVEAARLAPTADDA